MSMMRRTNITQDLSRMRAAVAEVEPLLMEQGQLMVTSRPGTANPLSDDLGWLPEGVQETDFTELNEPFRGGPIEELLSRLPFAFGRVRLMCLKPKSCLSIHADRGRRYHYALVTSPDCYLVEMDGNVGVFHHVPDDGYLYEMDAFLTHTALNAGRSARIHLVISSAEAVERPETAAEVGRVHGLNAPVAMK